MDYSLLNERARDAAHLKHSGKREGREFLKSFQFYCIALILFFYLGVENCINGWFVTYLQNTGVMSETYATTLVSVTWLVIMAGRLVCASLSGKMRRSSLILMNALGSGICFFLLISTKSLPLITLALIGFGFFLAGIYPTCIVAAIGILVVNVILVILLAAINRKKYCD